MSANDALTSGAAFEIAGTIANEATWNEDIYFSDDGSPLDISALDWKMTFRKCAGQTSADLTLSISGGELSVVSDNDGYDRVLRIQVAAGQLSSYFGDYICDLSSKSAAGNVVLWGHGSVSFRQNPVAF